MVATGGPELAGLDVEAAPGGANGEHSRGPRRIRPRGSLPGGRAVAGGLLVAVATVGTFAAYRGASGGPTTSYAVAAHELRPGEVIGAGDVRLRRVDLPGALAARAYDGDAALVGAIVTAPLAEGELVQRSAVAEGSGRAPMQELSFAVETERAVDGRLRPGERVDVLATYGTGTDARTQVVVRAALLAATSDGDGDLSGSTVVLTVALERSEDVLALTHAVRAGEVTVVRTTGVAPDAEPGRYPPERDGH
jgi:Flp pilus assembly protein CpaB